MRGIIERDESEGLLILVHRLQHLRERERGRETQGYASGYFTQNLRNLIAVPLSA